MLIYGKKLNQDWYKICRLIYNKKKAIIISFYMFVLHCLKYTYP